MAINFKNERELLDYTSKIIGKKVSDLFDEDQINSLSSKNKGKVGHLLEKYFYKYDLNSNDKPDFENLGIELKSTPIKKLKNGTFSPKERMSLSLIDQEDVLSHENIEDSKLWKKIEKILIIWYLNSEDFNSNTFEKIDFLEIKKNDLFKIIQDDWSIIRNLFLNGKAHKISESLTKYLGAARKGSGGSENKIFQKNSDVKYYRRGFTLKPIYLKMVLNNEITNTCLKNNYQKDYINYVEYLKDKFKNKKILDICDKKYLEYKKQGKNIPKHIANISIVNKLNFKSFSSLSNYINEEIGKMVTFKTVPVVLNKDGKYRIKESFKINVPISNEIINTDWEDSKFSEVLENEFITFIYKYNHENILKSKIIDVVNFNLDDYSYDFFIDAYNELKKKLEFGGLADKNGNINFIKASDKKNIHFRPWAKNSHDKFVSKSGEIVKKSGLWLNADFVYKLIFESHNELI